jgi:hypothetical protein
MIDVIYPPHAFLVFHQQYIKMKDNSNQNNEAIMLSAILGVCAQKILSRSKEIMLIAINIPPIPSQRQAIRMPNWANPKKTVSTG